MTTWVAPYGSPSGGSGGLCTPPAAVHRWPAPLPLTPKDFAQASQAPATLSFTMPEGPVEPVVRTGEFGHPLGPGPSEDERHLLVGLLELVWSSGRWPLSRTGKRPKNREVTTIAIFATVLSPLSVAHRCHISVMRGRKTRRGRLPACRALRWRVLPEVQGDRDNGSQSRMSLQVRENMRVYSDPASERHVNGLAGVEAPSGSGGARRGREGGAGRAPVEWCTCGPADEEVLARVHAPAYLEHLKRLSAQGEATSAWTRASTSTPGRRPAWRAGPPALR